MDDTGAYVYNGKSWKPSPTMSDCNSFFHAAFGVRAVEGAAYCDRKAKFRRMRWAAFLTYFEDEVLPSRLADTLKKCLSSKQASVEDPGSFEGYVSDLIKAERDVIVEEIRILATLDNMKVVLFSNTDSDSVIVINPDLGMLGSYPNAQTTKREVVLCLQGNTFARMHCIEDPVPAIKAEPVSTGLMKYKKGGSAGSEGVQYQVGLLTVFFLNSLRNLENWKLSTENKDAGKFDDVVLEYDRGAILLQAKHKQSKSKKIIFEDLVSTNSKNDDFSLPKYFLSYLEVKRTFQVKNVIICTNTSVDGKVTRFLKAHTVTPDSMLYCEYCDCSFFTFSDEIVPYLKENVKNYFEKNLQGKGIDESAITDKNLKDFLECLQFYSIYPPGNNIGKVIEQILSRMKHLNYTFSQISPLDLYTKILNWFQQKDGVYLTELYSKAIFSEIRRDKHFERLEKYNVSFQNNIIDPQDPKRIFHVVINRGYLLQEIQIFQTLQSYKTNTLFFDPDDGTEVLKQVIEAFGLPQYTTLALIFPKIAEETAVKEISGKLNEILAKYEYKRVILATECDSVLIRNVGSSIDVINEYVTFQDLSADSQKRLLKKKNIIFQGNCTSLEELGSIEDYGKLLDSETLEQLVKDEEIKVGEPILELEEQMQFYIKRKFKRDSNSEIGHVKEVPDDVVFEENIYDEADKVILISNAAGMGKSTILTSLMSFLKTKYPQLWVIKIDLNDYTKILKESLEEGINVTKLLNSKSVTKLSNHLERSVFSLNGKVVLMLDGVDEISPDYTGLILSMLRQCQNNSNFAKVFVTTRPHVAQQLEENLSVNRFTLQPFTQQNQIDFLTSYWGHNLKLDSTMTPKCERYARALINRMSSWTKHDHGVEDHFAAIPLQVRMLAEIFQENIRRNEVVDWEGCKEYLSGNKTEPNLPQNVNITSLYDMFVEQKRNLFFHKANPSSNTAANEALTHQFEECVSYHRKLALDIVLDRTQCELFSSYHQSCRSLETNALKIGIVQKVDQELHFIHRTFAEYFVAESVIIELQGRNKNAEFQRFVMEEIVCNPQFNVTRAFLDSCLHVPTGIFQEYHSTLRGIDLADQYKFNFIHQLAAEGCVSILQLLLNCIHFRVVKDKSTSLTDLYFADFDEDTRKHVFGNTLNILEYLVEQGGVNIIKDERNVMPLHVASQNGHLKMVEFLLAQGAMIDAKDCLGRTPLRLAVNYVYLDVVKFLVDQGADVASKDRKNVSILEEAVLGEQVAITAYLLEAALKRKDLSTSAMVCYTAAYLGRLDILKDLDASSIRIKNGETLMFGAALGGKLDAIDYLVVQGVDVNSQNNDGNTALHLAASRGRFDSVEHLVKLGASVNLRNNQGCTALHLAALSGQSDIIKFLVGHGGDFKITDKFGQSALHYAALMGRLVTLRFLIIVLGMDYNDKDRSCNTALHLAASRSQLDTVDFLIDLGVDINAQDMNGCTALHLVSVINRLDTVKFLVKHGATVDMRDNDGRTPLHLAAEEGALDTVKFLIKHNADMNLKDDCGRTALHLAARRGQLDTVRVLVVSCGADTNMRDKKGYTALHLAAEEDQLDTVRLLVEYGADISIKNCEGFTAMDLADTEGYLEVSQLLQECSARSHLRRLSGSFSRHLEQTSDVKSCSVVDERHMRTRYNSF